MSALTIDAMIFGLAYLNGPKSTLSFGGEGAEMEITPRAREALNCLINCGFAETMPKTDQIIGREFYRGLRSLGPEAKAAGIDPFDRKNAWPTFVAKGGDA